MSTEARVAVSKAQERPVLVDNVVYIPLSPRYHGDYDEYKQQRDNEVRLKYGC
ncbi:hypothetical protein [Achromobacter phage Motura]|uniref:Uncharacterized protein n=1 Tax=Achromobacter phage Motura TaxID=2591403 RepID=A0A514CSR7_9CAUD|nr:hypothetical protein H1O15_gp290 [Achromobacter phage Motura]QDH83516.1 hypothetical protein [Achromobacter phage Motura]